MKKVIILTVMLLVFLAGCEKDNKLESFHYKNDSGYHSLVYLSPSQVEALESLDKRIEMLSALRVGFSKLKASEHGFETDSRATQVDGWFDFFISWKLKGRADLVRHISNGIKHHQLSPGRD